MKNIFIFIFALCILSENLSATPESRVAEMISTIKSQGTYEALLDYIHWGVAFEKMTADQKNQLSVNSPDSLKQKLKQMMAHPEALLEQQFNARLGSVPPEQRAMMEQIKQQQINSIKQRVSEMQDKMKRTEYVVKSTRLDPEDASHAVVVVEGSVDGTSKLKEISLQKQDGEWYLSSVPTQGSGFFDQ